MLKAACLAILLLLPYRLAKSESHELVNYEKFGTLGRTFKCDGGKTKIREFNHKDWEIVEYSMPNGVILVWRQKGLLDSYFIRPKGLLFFEEITSEEWREIHRRLSASYDSYSAGKKDDCIFTGSGE